MVNGRMAESAGTYKFTVILSNGLGLTSLYQMTLIIASTNRGGKIEVNKPVISNSTGVASSNANIIWPTSEI